MQDNTPNNPVIVGITGASGSVIASALIDELLHRHVPVAASASGAARMVWQEEMSHSFGDAMERWQDAGDFAYYAPGELGAPIASGTFPAQGMAIVPCSMTTAAAIAHGLSDNLIRRAADVCIKERRPLTIVPRETPLNAIHLENLAALSRLGITVLPPEPPFYLKPQSLDDVVAFIVQRTIASLNITQSLPDDMQYRGPTGRRTSR